MLFKPLNCYIITYVKIIITGLEKNIFCIILRERKKKKSLKTVHTIKIVFVHQYIYI